MKLPPRCYSQSRIVRACRCACRDRRAGATPACWRINAPRGFVILDRFVVASESLQHARGVEISGQRTSGAREVLVSIVKLAETAKRETKIVQEFVRRWAPASRHASADQPPRDSFRFDRARNQDCSVSARLPVLLSRLARTNLWRDRRSLSCHKRRRAGCALHVNFGSSETAVESSEIASLIRPLRRCERPAAKCSLAEAAACELRRRHAAAVINPRHCYALKSFGILLTHPLNLLSSLRLNSFPNALNGAAKIRATLLPFFFFGASPLLSFSPASEPESSITLASASPSRSSVAALHIAVAPMVRMKAIRDGD